MPTIERKHTSMRIAPGLEKHIADLSEALGLPKSAIVQMGTAVFLAAMAPFKSRKARRRLLEDCQSVFREVVERARKVC